MIGRGFQIEDAIKLSGYVLTWRLPSGQIALVRKFTFHDEFQRALVDLDNGVPIGKVARKNYAPS